MSTHPGTMKALRPGLPGTLIVEYDECDHNVIYYYTNSTPPRVCPHSDHEGRV